MSSGDTKHLKADGRLQCLIEEVHAIGQAIEADSDCPFSNMAIEEDSVTFQYLQDSMKINFWFCASDDYPDHSILSQSVEYEADEKEKSEGEGDQLRHCNERFIFVFSDLARHLYRDIPIHLPDFKKSVSSPNIGASCMKNKMSEDEEDKEEDSDFCYDDYDFYYQSDHDVCDISICDKYSVSDYHKMEFTHEESWDGTADPNRISSPSNVVQLRFPVLSNDIERKLCPKLHADIIEAKKVLLPESIQSLLHGNEVLVSIVIDPIFLKENQILSARNLKADEKVIIRLHCSAAEYISKALQIDACETNSTGNSQGVMQLKFIMQTFLKLVVPEIQRDNAETVYASRTSESSEGKLEAAISGPSVTSLTAIEKFLDDSFVIKSGEHFKLKERLQLCEISTSDLKHGFIYLLYLYAQKRLATLNEYCVMCDDRHPYHNMMKPSVCEKELCIFSYQTLGVMNRKTDETISNPEIVEFLLATTRAAALSKHCHVLEPFPTVVDPNSITDLALGPKCKNFALLKSGLNAIPNVCTIVSKPAGELKRELDTANKLAFPLLQWIISSNRSHIEKLPKEKMLKFMDTPHQFILRCSSPLKEQIFSESRKKYGSTFAFHGSPLENWHSILRRGLIVATGTALQRHGSAYGSGIYLSPNSGVSFSFSGIPSFPIVNKFQAAPPRQLLSTPLLLAPRQIEERMKQHLARRSARASASGNLPPLGASLPPSASGVGTVHSEEFINYLLSTASSSVFSNVNSSSGGGPRSINFITGSSSHVPGSLSNFPGSSSNVAGLSVDEINIASSRLLKDPGCEPETSNSKTESANSVPKSSSQKTKKLKISKDSFISKSQESYSVHESSNITLESANETSKKVKNPMDKTSRNSKAYSSLLESSNSGLRSFCEKPLSSFAVTEATNSKTATSGSNVFINKSETSKPEISCKTFDSLFEASKIVRESKIKKYTKLKNPKDKSSGKSEASSSIPEPSSKEPRSIADLPLPAFAVKVSSNRKAENSGCKITIGKPEVSFSKPERSGVKTQSTNELHEASDIKVEMSEDKAETFTNVRESLSEKCKTSSVSETAINSNIETNENMAESLNVNQKASDISEDASKDKAETNKNTKSLNEKQETSEITDNATKNKRETNDNIKSLNEKLNTVNIPAEVVSTKSPYSWLDAPDEKPNPVKEGCGKEETKNKIIVPTSKPETFKAAMLGGAPKSNELQPIKSNETSDVLKSSSNKPITDMKCIALCEVINSPDLKKPCQNIWVLKNPNYVCTRFLLVYYRPSSQNDVCTQNEDIKQQILDALTITE